MNPRVIVALDFPSAAAAKPLVAALDPTLCRIKIGNELFTAAGPAFVAALIEKHFSVFLDLKFHDIPETVEKACRAAANLGVWMINVHASGGEKMLEAARRGISHKANPPLLVGVTLLTSLAAPDTKILGWRSSIPETVLRLAQLAKRCKLDGVVCSAQEAALLRVQLGPKFLLVTPGIRLGGEKQDDQQRVMTPQAARTAGADYLVVGRPITQNENPLKVLQEINRQISL